MNHLRMLENRAFWLSSSEPGTRICIPHQPPGEGGCSWLLSTLWLTGPREFLIYCSNTMSKPHKSFNMFLYGQQARHTPSNNKIVSNLKHCFLICLLQGAEMWMETDPIIQALASYHRFFVKILHHIFSGVCMQGNHRQVCGYLQVQRKLFPSFNAIYI